MIKFNDNISPEPELQLLQISMLAGMPTLTLLLCSPQMVIQDCVGSGGTWLKGTLQSTAAAHATVHGICVIFTTFAFTLGLLLDTLKIAPPRRPAALALSVIMFCNKVILVAAVINFFADATVSAGELVEGRLQTVFLDNSAALCVLYAVTVLSVLHVARWLYGGWTTMCLHNCDLTPLAVTAGVVTTLYLVALTIASSIVAANGLQMFRNASVASCKINNDTWCSMSLPDLNKKAF
ncbi:ORF119 peptide [Hyphantria cunea nucleopolyhedrovirus]|uniref:ORF119 peptide n=1 Tax=Hyphantria cunea nuclear polyhedrosis virus TaxID=28288 RepID=Q2NP37_NPVHC|nr:ORF119 peptide [Hyphantria cunea nucleopolyhedrovirus]BAE72408.1 ORF119 peptide [Hyphantria cunea nucleopolyhedrovirus]